MKLGKIFKRGALAIAPLALTLALVLWLFNALEGVFSVPIKAIIGPEHYFAGLGILVALMVIFLVGIVINYWMVQKLSSWGEVLLNKIPLVKTLYNSIREMMSYFRSKEQGSEGQVVQVDIAGMKWLGLVTRDSFEDLPEGVGVEGEICVFLPMSYQIGGYTVIVPRSKVKKVAMSVEEGMRFAVTAGVLAQSKDRESSQSL